MTTRQSLLRRRDQAGLSIFVLILTLGVYKSAQQEPVWNPVFAALLMTGLAFLVWNALQTPCLSCRKPLGWTALPWIVNPAGIADASPHCPNCDVSIDRDFPAD